MVRFSICPHCCVTAVRLPRGDTLSLLHSHTLTTSSHHLARAVSQHIQLYMPPSQLAHSSVKDEEKAQFKIDPSCPATNLGVPIVVVGCKVPCLRASVRALEMLDGYSS